VSAADLVISLFVGAALGFVQRVGALLRERR